MEDRKTTENNTSSHYSLAAARLLKEKYILRLYITGASSRSLMAVANIKKICNEYLDGRYELEVIDLFQYPALAQLDEIIASPTLIKKAPYPLRRIVGDMSNKGNLLRGLGIYTPDT